MLCLEQESRDANQVIDLGEWIVPAIHTVVTGTLWNKKHIVAQAIHYSLC